MPTIVRVDGAQAAHCSLNIPERQVLLHMDGREEGYWSHILFHRVDCSRWITCEPNLSIQVEDLDCEEIIPIPADADMPQAGRPYLCFDMMDEPTLAGLRARAAQLAEVHGVFTAVPVGLPSSFVWFFSDTFYLAFSPVLLGSHGSPVLFADAYRRLLAPVDLADEIPSAFMLLFEGPSAFMELARSVVASGMVTQGFAAQFLSTSGVSVTRPSVIVYRYVMQTIYFMVCVDRLNTPQLASAEHLARWALHFQRAICKNNRVTDFSGFGEYTAHASDLCGIF